MAKKKAAAKPIQRAQLMRAVTSLGKRVEKLSRDVEKLQAQIAKSVPSGRTPRKVEVRF